MIPKAPITKRLFSTLCSLLKSACPHLKRLKRSSGIQWTPFRLIQAFIAAGVPATAFGFYPTDHEGSGEVLKLSGRALIFGDANTVAQYKDNPKYECHGPGFSKIVIGDVIAVICLVAAVLLYGMARAG